MFRTVRVIALRDRLRVGHRHQLVDLREVADFCFELRGVDGGARRGRGEGERLSGLREERIAVDAQLALAPLRP